MPFVELTNCRIHYRLDGPTEAPVLVLSNSLGTDLSLWNPQIPVLSQNFRILRYDTRGHGQSSIGSKLHTVSELADDVIELLSHTQVEGASFCGISMGGMIGIALALAYPHRIMKLVLSNTAAHIGSPESWNARIASVQSGGISSIADSVIQRWFTPPFSSKHPGVVKAFRDGFLRTSPEGYLGCCEALRDTDFRESVSRVRIPTLIVAGSYDPVITVQDARFLAENIGSAGYLELPAAHLSNIETAEAFTEKIREFLA